MNRCAVTEDLNREQARQDALERQQGYVEARVNAALKDEDMVLEALTEIYIDNPEDLLYICAAWITGNKYKRRTPGIHWRIEHVHPHTAVCDVVREYLEEQIAEESDA